MEKVELRRWSNLIQLKYASVLFHPQANLRQRSSFPVGFCLWGKCELPDSRPEPPFKLLSTQRALHVLALEAVLSASVAHDNMAAWDAHCKTEWVAQVGDVFNRLLRWSKELQGET